MNNSRLKLIDTEGLKAKAFKFPAPLRELRDMTRKSLSEKLSTVFEHVDDTFFDLADRAESNSEQTAYFDAMRMIRLERKAIEQKFSISIDQAFQQLGDVNYQGIAYDSEKPGGFNLEVIENEDLEETIALDAMVSKVSQHEKHELKKIIARINFLVPAEVMANSNPLGPEIICNALNDALEPLDIDIRSKLVFFKLIDRHMIDGMGALLKSGNEMLREMGILPDLDKKHPMRRSQAKNAATRRPITKAQPAQVPMSGVGSNPNVGNHDELFAGFDENDQLLVQLQSLLQQSELIAPVADTESVELNDLVSLVSSLQGEWVEKKTNEQSLLGLIQGKLQSRGNAGLGARNQSVVHVLDQLFDSIRNEPSISDGLGQELRKLEMPMLRIALEDGSFFSKEKHPARQLLNQITEASIGYSDGVDFSSDPVGKAITNVANILNKSESLDRDTLGKLLVNFMGLVEKERRGSSAREQRIVEEVAAQEKVRQARKMVDTTLAERMQGKCLPQLFVSFAEEAWCKVMFLSYLRIEKSPEDWESSVKLLDQLLEQAAKEEVTKTEIEPLIALIRNQLEVISFDPYELGCLIGGLEQFFYPEEGQEPSIAETPATEVKEEKIVDLNELPVENENAEKVTAQLQPETTSAVKSSSSQPDRVKARLPVSEALMKEVTVETLKADIPGSPEKEDVQDEPVEDEFIKIASALGRGSWVDFMDREPPNRRCKVAGIISPPGKYIFVNRQGSKVVEMSQNAVAAGIKDNKLVVVESVRMFDKALEQVIKGIRTNRKVH
jgi:hypothetical protein